MVRALKIWFSLIIFIFPLALGVNFALATDVNLVPQVSIPGSDFQSGQEKLVKNDTSLICDYIIVIYKYGIAVIGVLAVLAVAIGGVMWIMSAGNSGVIAQGKEWIISGILGLVLALGSFMLLATINKDLVSCKITTLPSVAKINETKQAQQQAQKDSGLVYGKPGLTSNVVSKHLDSSGKYQCCVISAPIDGSGWLKDNEIKRCATYEANDKTIAQPACNEFYDNYSTRGIDKGISGIDVAKGLATAIGGIFTPLVPLGFAIDDVIDDNSSYKLNLETRESPPPTAGDTQVAKGYGNGKLHSATTYEGDCWTNPTTKEWCIGADNPTFCSKHKDTPGTACLVNGDFGYCENSTCHPCKKHCEKCTKNYECPNQLINPQTWLDKAKNNPDLMAFGNPGFVCGIQMYNSLKANSNDCSGDKCDREFDINGDGKNDDCP